MNIDHFGMDTITLAGPLEAKLRAIRETGFTQVMLNAGDLVGHPDGEPAAAAAVRQSGLRVTGFQVLRDFEGLSGHLHAYKVDVAKAMLQMCRALGSTVLLACSSTSAHATGEREALIRDRAQALAAEAGLQLVADEGLVAENAGLTEWPVPLLGRFDEAFLDVPPEVIQLTARVNQKYFVCTSSPSQVDGEEPKLANAFVCTANIEAADSGAAIVDGNRKVLAARLSDARFFWEQDLKLPLAEHGKKLDQIVFHEKLGTVADKVERVARLAEWLVSERLIRADFETVGRAARLAKADLVTEMVGEFPELQGLMGGYYARAEDLPAQVADAIRDHYKPVGQGDEVPTAPVTVAVSLADKLDTLAHFFAFDETPTGSKDPFALRRTAISIIRLLVENAVRANLRQVIARALPQPGTDVYAAFEALYRSPDEPLAKVDAAIQRTVDFFADRLKVQQREAGVRHDLIDAVFALGNEDDLVRLLSRVNALQNFIRTDDGANLLVAYKRAANILRKENWQGAEGDIPRTGEEDPLALVDDPELKPVVEARLAEKKKLSYSPEPAERELTEALDSAEPKARAAVEAEDFEAAMAALATLRAPIDRFFDTVTVNDDDAAKRSARLDLLARFRDAVHQVADFSKIEG